jgi:glycosyltransferase involved in cell wall biosynthesis
VCVGISLSPHAVFAKIGSIACRAKTINWFIGTDIYFRLNNSRWESIFKCLVKNASCTMTMGSRSTKLLATMGWDKRKILVGRNAYDFTDYQDGKDKIQWDVIYTGRLDRWDKRIDLLILAVSELCKFNPSLKCAIAGEGPDRQRLERICNSLCLDSNVAFLGHQKDIPGLLSQSRILIMTSAWEGLPASVVEAFVMGLPVIAANVGDLSDLVVHNQNGILINSADPLDYAKAILRLLENDEEYDRMRFLAKRTGENMRKEMETGIPVVRWQHALEMALENNDGRRQKR